MLKILSVGGARPNFMKLAPLCRAAAAREGVDHVLVHTGQHYDDSMSRVFFEQLGLPKPAHELGVGSGSHAEQTARVMLGLEPVLKAERPGVVVVVGDVNSTAAAALTAAKLDIRLAHVEAGLRSFDRDMPEELNRMVTDALSDVLLAPSRDAVDNLRAEGAAGERIHFVGNVMIDTLDALAPQIGSCDVVSRLGLADEGYIAVTLHRPSNVDDPDDLNRSVDVLSRAASLGPVVLVAHPRTAARLEAAGVELTGGVRVLEPMGYVDFLALVSAAGAVLTDSGGIQEETTVLGVPCVTMRTTTERPVTVTEGTNILAGTDPDAVEKALRESFGRPRRPVRPELWDGRASERILDVLTA